VDLYAVAGTAAADALTLFAEGGEGGGEAAAFQINLFWVITQAASFLLFLAILYFAAFRRIGGVLEERRARIEQGLKDADAARQERERAADERRQVLAQAREEANGILGRAQRIAEETHARELAETRAELERVRAQATEEIGVEKQRALSEIRGEVAELALRAASKVVGETMNDERERRLVEEFLTQVGADGRGSTGRSSASSKASR
jgi:F-type H+-transporting ATPase subunit b